MSGKSIACPKCRSADTDTVISAPYIRGYVLAYTYGTKRFVGCKSCVRKQLAGEVGLSLLTGWFSITALFVNPMCILWNGLRLPFVKANQSEVDKLLNELGIDTGGVDLPRVAAALAAVMVAADGKIEQEEVETAVGLGVRLVEGFTPQLFQEVLGNVKTLPGIAELAAILRDSLEEGAKVSVLKYLTAIAASDGHIDQSEIDVLRSAASGMGIPMPDIRPGALPD